MSTTDNEHDAFWALNSLYGQKHRVNESGHPTPELLLIMGIIPGPDNKVTVTLAKRRPEDTIILGATLTRLGEDVWEFRSADVTSFDVKTFIHELMGFHNIRDNFSLIDPWSSLSLLPESRSMSCQYKSREYQVTSGGARFLMHCGAWKLVDGGIARGVVTAYVENQAAYVERLWHHVGLVPSWLTIVEKKNDMGVLRKQ
jgi:hypothetical protein